MQVVIGLAGVKTAGKSTVTNILRKHFPTLKEAALAEKLKNVCAEVYDVPRNYFDDQKYKEIDLETPRRLTQEAINAILSLFNVDPEDFVGKFDDVLGMELKSPRVIAQIVGTQILRCVGEDIHCENIELGEGVTVVSDVRFPNEFAYLSKKPGILFIPIYIKRNAAEAFVTPDSHASETSVFQFCDQCYLVDNNGTLEQTEAQVMKIVNGYLQDGIVEGVS